MKSEFSGERVMVRAPKFPETFTRPGHARRRPVSREKNGSSLIYSPSSLQ